MWIWAFAFRGTPAPPPLPCHVCTWWSLSCVSARALSWINLDSSPCSATCWCGMHQAPLSLHFLVYERNNYGTFLRVTVRTEEGSTCEALRTLTWSSYSVDICCWHCHCCWYFSRVPTPAHPICSSCNRLWELASSIYLLFLIACLLLLVVCKAKVGWGKTREPQKTKNRKDYLFSV